MNRWTLKRRVLAVVLLLWAAPLAAQSNTMTAAEQANLRFVLDWWREVLEARHLDLAPKYMAETYIQHYINVQTGRADGCSTGCGKTRCRRNDRQRLVTRVWQRIRRAQA